MSIVSPQEAIKQLNNDDVVALPTETVYGLAGKVNSEESLKKIFQTKNRPLFDPLIVHVKNIQQAKEFGELDQTSEALAKNYWPGPLTLVVNKTDKVSDLITNGGDTVALRSPNHPLFLEVLNNIDSPLAAPSANMFGKTSPTEAQHVINEFDDKVSVVDGGTCKRGIESTVIKVNTLNKVIEILRPGMIDKLELESFIAKNNLSYIVEYKQSPVAPGHLEHHYQPEVPLCLVTNSLDEDGLKEIKEVLGENITEWNLPNDPSVAARNLYKDLRRFSQLKIPIYIELQQTWAKDSRWKGILDRLSKASHLSASKQNNAWTIIQKKS